ncbi:sporulation and cell division protein SsgA [Herbihabitans rhizosphaerae]|uniref:Sporulation and cell division protein SsgA n=1 Tax=Herbihabitans rhizosphaerae TaxID=1872711 RepID=A0A4Q7KKC7_9PSEU|nr:SsgA family sporulation/cell division regulator [Herbihabitans rhizosphaerae]RZS36915.1 sporulation and cell division protein SsgA [Herbihabitans rhizosphaerae]
MTTDAVHTEQLIALYGGTTPVRSRWTYQASSPYTVIAEFQTSHERWVRWMFARELLVDGLVGPAGIGDVRLRPEGIPGREMLIVEIESPEGHAELELDITAVEAFVDATAELVPLGQESEHFDVERLIAEITNV